MAVLIMAEMIGFTQRQRVIDVTTETVNELLIVHWDDDARVARLSKDDIRERVFAVLGDSDSIGELVSLMFEQFADDFSVFGWDIEDAGAEFVFRPAGVV